MILDNLKHKPVLRLCSVLDTVGWVTEEASKFQPIKTHASKPIGMAVNINKEQHTS